MLNDSRSYVCRDHRPAPCPHRCPIDRRLIHPYSELAYRTLTKYGVSHVRSASSISARTVLRLRPVAVDAEGVLEHLDRELRPAGSVRDTSRRSRGRRPRTCRDRTAPGSIRGDLAALTLWSRNWTWRNFGSMPSANPGCWSGDARQLASRCARRRAPSGRARSSEQRAQRGATPTPRRRRRRTRRCRSGCR